MRLPRECHRMKQVIETHLPHLTQPQLTGLAWWVCGAILAGSACQNAVAAAPSTRSNWNNLRQYLREWLYDGSDRARPCRTDLDVSLCFVPLLRWVLAWWRNRPAGPGGGPHVEKGRHRRHRHQRALPGLRHSRGLAHPPGQPAGVLDGPDSGTAGGTGAGGARGNDRGGAVRPGPGQSEIVETDTRSRLASLHEVCEKRHLLRRGRSKAASPRLRPTSRYRRDRQGNRLQQRRSSETPLHPAGGLVRGTGGVVDYPDRPSPDQVGVSRYALRFWIELGFKSLKAWAGNGSRPAGPAQPASPGIGWCCRWRRCWLWPMAPGWKTPMTGGWPPAACERRPGLW